MEGDDAATQMAEAEQIVAAVREAVGDEVELMIEVHGVCRQAAPIEMGRRLAPYRPGVVRGAGARRTASNCSERSRTRCRFPSRPANGFTLLEEFERLTAMRACDIVQMDLAHCGGLAVGKKIAALAQAPRPAPRPALFDRSGGAVRCRPLRLVRRRTCSIQENFADYDVPWRGDFVHGWDPCRAASSTCPPEPGLGIELNPAAFAAPPVSEEPLSVVVGRPLARGIHQRRERGRPHDSRVQGRPAQRKYLPGRPVERRSWTAAGAA